MEKRTACPFCGENIAIGAKKCRFCGEWIQESISPSQQSESLTAPTPNRNGATKPQSLERTNQSGKVTLILKSVNSDQIEVCQIIKSNTNLDLSEAKNIVDSASAGNPCIIKKGLEYAEAERFMRLLQDKGSEVSLVPENNNYAPSVEVATHNPIEATSSSPMQPQSPQLYQQPQIVVNVQNNQSVEQHSTQQQTMTINQVSSSDDSAPGWISLEMLAIGGFIWAFTGSWIWGLVTFIGGFLLLCIPFLGAILCWALGIAWGIILGAVGYGLFHSEAAGWIIGIIAAIGIGYGHYKAREKHMKEFYE